LNLEVLSREKSKTVGRKRGELKAGAESGIGDLKENTLMEKCLGERVRIRTSRFRVRRRSGGGGT